jgi:polyhydroxyalkanoate synthesis regulator phasin
MAQNQLFRRYLDAGIQFSQMTQQRAEAIVRDLVKAGEVQAEQTQAMVNDLVERSRKNTDRFVDQIRKEVRNQLEVAEVVTKDVVARMQAQIDDLRSQLPGGRPAKKSGAKKSAAKKTAVKKKAPAKKAAAKKAPAKKKAAAKKSAAKAPAKTAPAQQAAPATTVPAPSGVTASVPTVPVTQQPTEPS